MAPAIPFISAAVGAFASYSSYRQQKKAASAQEAIAEQNAALKEAETHEEATRLRENQRRALAEARAAGAATGIVGGTQDIYTSDIAKTQQRELAWLQKAGASQANIIKAEGQLQADITRASAQGALFDAVGYGLQAAGSLSGFSGGGTPSAPQKIHNTSGSSWWGR